MHKFAIGVFLLTSSLASYGQNAPTMVNLPDDPIKLVSVEMTQDNQLNTVTVRNATARTVESYQLGLVMAVMAGCGPAEVIGIEERFGPSTTPIAPSERQGSTDFHLSPQHLLEFGRHYLSSNTHAQLAVVHVKFSDGSTWDYSPKDRIYDRDLMGKYSSSYCYSSGKMRLQNAVVSCSSKSATLLKVQTGSGGGYYKCGDGAGQICSNSPTARSCTSIICEGGNCPGQQCVPIGTGSGPAPPRD